MSATSKIFQVTEASTGETVDISSDDLLLVIESGTGSYIQYEDGGNEIAELVVDEAPATISTSSQWLIPLVDVTTGATFYLNADKINSVSDNGSGSDVYVDSQSYSTTRKFRASDSRGDIRAAIAAIVADASGEFMTLVGTNTTTATNSFSGIQTYTNIHSYYTQKNIASTPGGQADATLLTRQYNEVTSSTGAGEGVKLLPAVAGYVQIVKNSSTDSIKVYPSNGDNINSLAVDTAIDLPVGAQKRFTAVDATKWEASSEVISSGDGSVSNPSITFDSNPDTGFYKVSDTQTGHAVGGALSTILDDEGVSADTVRLRVAVGTPGTGVTAKHYGDGKDITTELTLTGVEFPIAGAANEAIGKLIYTFPNVADAHLFTASVGYLTLQGGGTVNADTPDVGLGSVEATGAVALLSGTATFEDYATGQTWADCNGSAQSWGPLVATAGALTGISLNSPSDVKTLYLNIADGWAGADTVTVNGKIVLKWTYMASGLVS